MSAREIAVEIVNALRAKGISANVLTYRDGFVTIIAQAMEKRIAIWVRQSPVTKSALDLINRILSKYELDEVVVFRQTDVVDFVKTPYRVFTDLNDLLKLFEG